MRAIRRGGGRRPTEQRGHQQVDTRGLILCSSLFLTHTNHHPTRVIGSLSSPDRYQSLRWTILNFYQRRRHDRKHAPFARLNGRHKTTSRAIEKNTNKKKYPARFRLIWRPKGVGFCGPQPSPRSSTRSAWAAV